LGYSEELAHRIEAGADIFLMPSRFEPCGLNQMYSLRYGTPPLVHHVGGLADTVVDASPENISSKLATGFVFHEPDADAILHSMERALELYKHPANWHKLIRTAMAQDFGWTKSASDYIQLYQEINTSGKP
jgi:starch synthase